MNNCFETFTSAKTITLLHGFSADAGSNVSFYIAHYNCNEFSIFPTSKESIVFLPENNFEEISESNSINITTN